MSEYIYEVDGFRINKKQELIRCKDCKHFSDMYIRTNYKEEEEWHLCPIIGSNVPNGHCNFAERKEE